MNLPLESMGTAWLMLHTLLWKCVEMCPNYFSSLQKQSVHPSLILKRVKCQWAEVYPRLYAQCQNGRDLYLIQGIYT